MCTFNNLNFWRGLASATLGFLSGCVAMQNTEESNGTNNSIMDSSSLDSVAQAVTHISGDCNIVVNVINSSSAKINNISQCPNITSKTASDVSFCEQKAHAGYVYVYPKGLLTLPFYPVFSISNYINKEGAQRDANQLFTNCMEGRGHIMNGYGMYNFENGNTYQGSWKDGTFDGEGIFRWKDGGSYDGEWKNGQKSGKGFDVYSDGVTYKGEFQNGVRSGYGTQHWPDGRLFEGTFSNDRPNGLGTFVASNGDRYEGTWSNGCFRDGNRWASVDQIASYCH